MIEKEPSQEVIDLLRDNCFILAQSLCQYLVNNKTSAMTAAGYYVMSGRLISDVINYILLHHTAEVNNEVLSLVKEIICKLFISDEI